MSIRTETCVVVACEICGDGWADCDYGTPHFTSRSEALQMLHDHYHWTATEIEQVCDVCTTERTCAAEGHEWDEWRNGARSFTGTRSRWCQRDHCVASETEPIPSKFPKVGPR